MVKTRSKGAADLEHVLTNILRLDPDHPTRKALARDNTTIYEDLLSIEPAHVADLEYPDVDGTLRKLDRPMRANLLAWNAFLYVRTLDNNPVGDDVQKVTYEEFHAFRVGGDYTAYTGGRLPRKPPKELSPSYNITRDPLQDFLRGIKRDPTHFTAFKHDRQWDEWQRTTKATADAQHVSEVLDPDYKPPNLQMQDLFNAKQTFMFKVFNDNILTDAGKALVRKHAPNSDAQAIYRDLCKHMELTNKASLSPQALLSYITSVKLSDGRWKGTAAAFIHHWQEQVRLYEEQGTSTLPEDQRLVLLKNTVSDISALSAVDTQASVVLALEGKELTYQPYVNLLTAAAVRYDKTQAPKTSASTRSGHQRSIYAHDLTAGTDATYDIDSDIHLLEETYLVNAAHGRPPGPRLTGDQWRRLGAHGDAQKIWDQLPDLAKAIILEPRPGPSSLRPSKDRRTAQVHDFPTDSSVPPTTVRFDDGSTAATSSLTNSNGTPPAPAPAPPSDNPLLAHVTDQQRLSPGNLHRLLSPQKPNSETPKKTEANQADLLFEGKRYRVVNMADRVYRASTHSSTRVGALIDRGANGGIAGSDVRIISKHQDRFVDVQGIDNHQMVDIPIVTAGATVLTQRGNAILVMHQYAYTGKGKTIHSSGQLEAFNNIVDDRSNKVGGTQRITTYDGYIIPLRIQSGLPYMDMRPYTDDEWDNLPHIILTADTDWSPSVLDHDHGDMEAWFDAQEDAPPPPTHNLFDEVGNYRHHYTVTCAEMTEETVPEDYLLPTDVPYEVFASRIRDKPPDYEALRPKFGFVPASTVKRTFDCTTRFGRIPMSTHLQKTYRSPYPAMNVQRRNEPLATDTVYADTPAVDSGCTSAQFFVGTKSYVCDIYGMKSDKEFSKTLEDVIRTRGAPTKLVSDSAQTEISKKANDILRSLFIGRWQSEAHQQHQNPAERRYQTVKRTANTLMDRFGSPAFTWLLALMYVCFILNHTAISTLNWRTPLEALTGSTPDISPLLRFHWWEPVYYHLDDSRFPSESPELRGRFVGIAENVGHAMTFKVLTDDTNKVIHRSNIRSAADPFSKNLRVDPVPADGEAHVPPIIKSPRDRYTVDDEGNVSEHCMPTFDPEALIGRTFLTLPREKDGHQFRARIVRAIEDHETSHMNDPDRLKFVCSINNDQFEEIMSYNDIMEFIEKEEANPTVWKFRRIVAHEGPLTPDHPSWNGSSYNVMIEWENSEVTSEPLAIIAKDDPVTCALYARDHNLLDTDGWKRFRKIAKRQKKLFRMANQAKLRSFRTAPKYMYGFEVPRNYIHALELDRRNGNTKWQDCTKLEMQQLHDYSTFIDMGHKDKVKPPRDHKRIRVHLVYAVKHDGRHKARLVADGHLTDIPVDSVYSGVVSLRGLRLIIFLAELNHLELWATDIGNAYLEARTKERLYIEAGSEFGELEGHFLIIHKALYGLRTSGLRWHERFADCLRDLGFFPCKAEPDIWMRQNGDVYEYIGVYVDDLAIAMKDPKPFVDTLTNKHSFKLKGTGPITYHLGCDFTRDEDNTLCMAPRKYIERMMDQYERMFGSKPRAPVYSPLEKGDHPEIDDSDILDDEDVSKYQSLVGSMQWAVSLGRIDIATAVMTLSSFRAAPRKGHLERAKRVYSWLSKMRHGALRVRTEEPDYSDLHIPVYDWAQSVYGDAKEFTPDDAPTPLGKFVTLTHYVDANLFHCMLTGRSVTGILHFANQFPIDWFAKKQATVETATYGSEYVAARTCVEQIIDLRTTLRYLGVPIRDKSYMFGDNKTVVDSSTVPHSKLHKRHTALSFHRVREAIASGYVVFTHINSEDNPADILSKHWGYQQIWSLLQPLMFYPGNPSALLIPKEPPDK